MTRLAERNTQTRTPMRMYVIIAACLLAALLIATVSFLAGTASSQAHAPASRPSALTGQCTTTASQWSPVGIHWHLTVTFLSGPRRGQSEASEMTFARNGTLTATFPGATPSSPPTLSPAIDGFWCMTGYNTFHYSFRDPVWQNGHLIAYVLPSVSAYLTSATTYEAGSVGVAYNAKTGQPIPGQYGVTQTLAHA